MDSLYERERAMPEGNGQTQAQRDHDILLDIRAKVEMILVAQQNFVHRDELKPIIDRESYCSKRFERFVTKEEFMPVKSFVYGMITVITVGVLGGILTLVLRT